MILRSPVIACPVRANKKSPTQDGEAIDVSIQKERSLFYTFLNED